MAQLLSTGQRVSGRYVVTNRIGHGGFAEVYGGTDEVLGREVAIKQIRSELSRQPAFIRRFEAEAHLVARIEQQGQLPNGTKGAVLRGLRRVRIGQGETGADGVLRVAITELPQPPSTAEARAAATALLGK